MKKNIWCFMKLKSRGFTLVELLVVISIIALLLAVLMPALSKAREQARSITDRTQLSQWGKCYFLYSYDSGGRMPVYSGGSAGGSPEGSIFTATLAKYCSDVKKIRMCPSASLPNKIPALLCGTKSYYGDTTHAWYLDKTETTSWFNDDWGMASYVENSWIRRATDKVAQAAKDGKISYLKMSDLQSYCWGRFDTGVSSEIPLLLDGRHNNFWPQTDAVIRVNRIAGQEYTKQKEWFSLGAAIMKRHQSNGVNVVFLDSSARYVDIIQLWSLRWHSKWEMGTVNSNMDKIKRDTARIVW